LKIINITNIKGIGGANGGNNIKESNNTRNINNTAAFIINIKNILFKRVLYILKRKIVKVNKYKNKPPLIKLNLFIFLNY
jgi:hypothetical protein